MSAARPPSLSAATAALASALRDTRHIGFGHQDDLAYGAAWRSSWSGNDAKPWWQSDVAMISGKLPSVFGWDVGGFD
eukprot:4871088-Prymnesium_polylepis.1